MERRTFLHGSAAVEREGSKSGEWVQRGGDTLICRWGAGERESGPESVEPAIRFDGTARLDAERCHLGVIQRLHVGRDDTPDTFRRCGMARCQDAPEAGRDATGGAQRASLAKMVRYDRTHLASRASGRSFLFCPSLPIRLLHRP